MYSIQALILKRDILIYKATVATDICQFPMMRWSALLDQQLLAYDALNVTISRASTPTLYPLVITFNHTKAFTTSIDPKRLAR